MSIYYSLVKRNIADAKDKLKQIRTNDYFEMLHENIVSKIVNTVHSIADYYERLDRHILTDEMDLWFKGFTYINNQIKHDKELEIIHYPVYGSMYSMGYPMRYGPRGYVGKILRIMDNKAQEQNENIMKLFYAMKILDILYNKY